MDQAKTIAVITTDQMLRAGLSRLSVLRMAALSPKVVRVHRTIYGMEIQDHKDKVLILSFILHANSYTLLLSALSFDLQATSFSKKLQATKTVFRISTRTILKYSPGYQVK